VEMFHVLFNQLCTQRLQLVPC